MPMSEPIILRWPLWYLDMKSSFRPSNRKLGPKRKEYKPDSISIQQQQPPKDEMRENVQILHSHWLHSWRGAPNQTQQVFKQPYFWKLSPSFLQVISLPLQNKIRMCTKNITKIFSRWFLKGKGFMLLIMKVSSKASKRLLDAALTWLATMQ